MSLLELTNDLSKTFDACLEFILTDPQQKEENASNVDTQIDKLKASFHNIESQIKDIRLKALSSKELSIQESNRLLKRDIEIKKNTIEKYVTKLETWEKELPILKENSIKALSNRNDGNDFDSDIPPVTEEEPSMETVIEPTTNTTNENNKENTATNMEEDDDEDEDVEFEEV